MTINLHSRGAGVISAVKDQPGLYIPGVNPQTGLAWGSNLQSKLVAGKGTLAVMADSIAHGAFSSSLRTKAWPKLLNAQLQTKWGDGGSGFYGAVNSSLGLTARAVATGVVTAYGTAGDLYTVSGTMTASALAQPGQYGLVSTAVNDTITAPANVIRGRYIDVVTTGAAGFSYVLDGGASVPITGLSVTAGATNVTTIDAGSTGTHTLVFKTTAATTTFLGVRGRNTAGAIVDSYALYGANSSTQGTTIGARQGGSLAPATLQADMLMYCMFANDAQSGTTTDTYMQNVVGMTNAYFTTSAGGTPNGYPDLMFVLPHMGKYDNAAPARGRLTAAVSGFCRSEGYAYVDLHSLGRNSWDYLNTLGAWGNSASLGAAGTDPIHLSDVGQQFYATQIARVFQSIGVL